MNSAPKLSLSVAERTKLKGILFTPTTPRAVRLRARAILACAQGKSNLVIGRELKVTNLTIGKWRREFLVRRLQDFVQERRGRSLSPLRLSSNERAILEKWAEPSDGHDRLVTRARVILQCAAGEANVAIARKLRLSPMTVGKLRRRFLLKRLDGAKVHYPGRRVAALHLTAEEKSTLQAWALYSSSATLARRARAILISDMGQSNNSIGRELQFSERTIGCLRRRFLEQRLSGLTYGCELYAQEVNEIIKQSSPHSELSRLAAT